jgi:nicotinamide-nucleotide amidase
MARAGRERTGASHCLSITGIAGPDGGSAVKPVGTVYIGLSSVSVPTATHTRHFLFAGDREDIRRRSAVSALAMLHFAICGRPASPGLRLWE